MSDAAYLILANGEVFKGKSFGAKREVTGELVFTTSMVGYLETITDPSYYGQVVMQTFPLIGNYGVIPRDFESSKPALSAYIVREWCQEPSNFRCEEDLDTFLKRENIPGIYAIDTRRVTRIVREQGVMNCCVAYSLDDMDSKLEKIRSFRVLNAVKSVTAGSRHTENSAEGKYRVVLWDFGAKGNIERMLLKRGCNVTVVPADTTAEQILELNPDGLMLSNGPGDPCENTGIITELRKFMQSGIPVFGICLGHQLLALAMGAKTEKLKYGHRGANQPVKEVSSSRVYISSQNHGYAVVSGSLPDNAEVSFVNGNDNTCEGVTYTNRPAFSVQFHPEACGGPLDTEFLFDDFIAMMN